MARLLALFPEIGATTVFYSFPHKRYLDNAAFLGLWALKSLRISAIFCNPKGQWTPNNGCVRTPPPTQNLTVDALLDEDFVELKNGDRMARLRPRMSTCVALTFKAGPISRIMRRDWNIVSTKLYYNALSHVLCKQIESDMDEFGWQVSDTADQVNAMPFHRLEESWLRPRNMQIEVVHPITAAWLRAMNVFDGVYAKLICAEKAGMITRSKRLSLMIPCHLSYMAFKCTAMDIRLKSTDELLDAEERP